MVFDPCDPFDPSAYAHTLMHTHTRTHAHAHPPQPGLALPLPWLGTYLSPSATSAHQPHAPTCLLTHGLLPLLLPLLLPQDSCGGHLNDLVISKASRIVRSMVVALGPWEVGARGQSQAGINQQQLGVPVCGISQQQLGMPMCGISQQQLGMAVCGISQ